jgi:hypothetical protein
VQELERRPDDRLFNVHGGRKSYADDDLGLACGENATISSLYTWCR